MKRSLIFEGIEEEQVGHYTRIESIKHLVAKEPEEKNKLRLNNVAYMNDPSEGHVFLDLLNNQILNDYYFTIGEKETRQIMNDSDTYLGSFSTNVDSLPLWVQYGNNGQGCCLIFNRACFDEEEPITPLRMPSQVEIAHANEEENLASPKYCLYRVIYINSIDDLAKDDPLLDQLQKVSELLSNIDREMKKTSDTSAKEELRRIVINAIDQVRFLFKNKDFAHEHELRIVTTSYNPIADEGKRAREIPHLYVVMEKELKYDEIILGPKVEKPSEVAPYIYYTGKVKRVTKSSIKYQ